MKTEWDYRMRRLEMLKALRDFEHRTSDTILMPDNKPTADTVVLMGMIQAITWILSEDPKNEAAWIHSTEAEGRHRLKTERQIRQKREQLRRGLQRLQPATSGVIYTPEGRSTSDERALIGMVQTLTWAVSESAVEQNTWQSDISRSVEEYTFDDWVGITSDVTDITDEQEFEQLCKVREIIRGS